MIILPSTSSGFGLTLSEMIDEVAGQMRNTNVDTRITSWLNQAMLEFASDYEFAFLHASSNLSLLANVRTYTLATNLFWLKFAWIDGQTPPMIFPTTESDLCERDTFFLTQTGEVRQYTLNERTLSVWRVPAQNEILKYQYQRRPNRMVSPSDHSDLPAEWDPLIIQRAKIRAYEYERNPLLDNAVQEYKVMKKDRTRGVYHRSDFPIILKEYSRGGRYLGRPQLPSNYPRI